MIYLNNNTRNFNSSSSHSVNSRRSFENPTLKKDSVSFSSADTNNKKKKNNLIAYIAGGVALLAGIIILIKARKEKIISNTIKNAEETLKTAPASPIQTNELTQLNKKLAEQQVETTEIEKKLATPKNNTSNEGTSKPESKDKEIQPPVMPQKKTSQSQSTTKPTATVKPATVEEQADKAYAQYAHKLATELKLEGKEALIREALPDLMTLKNNDDALKEILGYITSKNRNFITKTAVPAILRNSDALDLGKAMGITLKIVSPDTVDCLDRLAVNAKKFKIKSQVDSTNLLRALTKENKDFAFNDLFPYLAENMEKYRLRQSGMMGKFLEVITPQNKDFVLNEALPILLKNSNALNIDIIDALKITKHLNKNNLKKVQSIADNIENLKLKDSDGFLDINKFVAQLKK